jgi:hypothetical protein
LILVSTLVLTGLFPSSRGIIHVTFLSVSLALASLVVVAKNREAYRQGKLARRAFVGHSIFDVFSILLAMVGAGLLANVIAQMMNVQVGSNIVRIVAVIAVSVLAGMGIGVLMRRIRRQILRPSYQ